MLSRAITPTLWCHKEAQEECAFCQVILASLYRGLFVLARNRLPSVISIPYWLLNGGAKIYFPNAYKITNDSKERSSQYEVSTDEFLEYLINENGICTREADKDWLDFHNVLNRHM